LVPSARRGDAVDAIAGRCEGLAHAHSRTRCGRRQVDEPDRADSVKSYRLAILGALAATSLVACGDDGVVTTAPDPLPCHAPERRRGPDRVHLEPAFPGVALEDSVAMVWPPGNADHAYVVAQSGTVWRATRDGGAPAVAVELRDEVVHDGESGLLDMVLHPSFPGVPDAFLSYVARRDGQLVSRVTRMSSTDGGITFDRSTESLVLEVDQPFTNHKGGELAFGPDGHLYFGLGDGGGAADPFGNGQNPNTLLGKLIRVDIDGERPFTIPSDNPFAAGGGRPEIYAVGFRNPWRFSFDDETGDLWVGDVGQNEWEEVDKVTRGGNYGWSVMEGEGCFEADTCDTDAFIQPVAQYRNTGGASVIGGVVVRGGDLASFDGTYIFSDFFFGTIFGIHPDGSVVDLGGGAGGVAAWSLSPAGEVFAIAYGGEISRLALSTPAPDAFPRKLSETGCVDVDHPREAARGTRPYDVRMPFWSDGADKSRFIAMGEGEVAIGPDGDWDLPAGTVLVKSFFRAETPVETRLLVRHDDGGWAGYGYAWRPDGSDAELVEQSFEDVREGAPWVFPSSRDCDACHTAISGFSLGITSSQLAVDDQLARLALEGLLPSAPNAVPLPTLDGDAPVEARARAYLDVNCAMCHQPDGPAGRAQMDLRAATPLDEAGLCNEAPRGGDLDIEDAVIVAPGNPARSVLSARLRATGSAHMPPVAITSVDEVGAAVVDAWIESLGACP